MTDFTVLVAILAAAIGGGLGRGLSRLIGRLERESGFSPPQGRRLPAVELACAAAFLACWACLPAPKAACGCVFMLGLIGATRIDLDHMIIPDLFTVGLALAGLALSFAVPSLHVRGPVLLITCLRSGAAAALGLAIGSALGLWTALLGELALDKEVLGFGDVKFLGAIGAFCGWQGAVFSVFGGAVLGVAALAIAAILRLFVGESATFWVRTQKAPGSPGSLGKGIQFPFGPMLAAAAGIYFLALHPWADRYLDQYLFLF